MRCCGGDVREESVDKVGGLALLCGGGGGRGRSRGGSGRGVRGAGGGLAEEDGGEEGRELLGGGAVVCGVGEDGAEEGEDVEEGGVVLVVELGAEEPLGLGERGALDEARAELLRDERRTEVVEEAHERSRERVRREPLRRERLPRVEALLDGIQICGFWWGRIQCKESRCVQTTKGGISLIAVVLALIATAIAIATAITITSVC